MTGYTGCVSYWHETSFPILISPDDSYTDEDLVYVNAAADVWNEAVGAEVFVVFSGLLQRDETPRETEGVEFGHMGLNGTYLGYCPTVYKPTLNGMAGEIWRAGCLLDKPDIEDKKKYVKVVIHELGHALGFYHDANNTKSIMYPVLLDSEQDFLPKHLDTVRRMMNGTYKRKSIAGLVSCF